MIAHGPLVVKLGGSLAREQKFAHWIGALRNWKAGAIIVPGGGPFADCVRDAQTYMRFSDAAAHRMALLAMEQYALACASAFPDLLLAGDEEQLRRHISAGRIAFWLPSRMAHGADDLIENWQVTSDTLSLWLALRLEFRRVLVVKSIEAPGGDTTAEALAERGIVDPFFARFAARTDAEIRLTGPADLAGAAALFAAGALPGKRVLAAAKSDA